MKRSEQVLKGRRILMLLDAPYPRDIRVEKESAALIQAGAEVTVVCYRRKGEEVRGEYKGVNILRTPKAISEKFKGVLDIVNSIFFKNPQIEKVLDGLPQNFDAVHVHDLPLTQTGLSFARKRGICTVYDMHENYPDALKIWFSWRKSPLIRFKNRLFFNPEIWFKRERRMVRSFDRVITVVDEMKQRIVDLYKVDPTKITVVSNTEPKNLFADIPDSNHGKPFGQRALIYVGSFGPHRGLDTVVKAMPIIKKKVPEVELVIVGTGNKDTIRYLKDLAKIGKVQDSVRFTGQLPFEEAIEYMKGAFLNLIPHHSNGQNENGLPHKLFQILNSNFPLIVSSCKPLKRIIETDNAGLVFEAGNPESFAEKVIWADKNPEELKEMAKRGRALVQEKGYNWETDGQRLIDMYRFLTFN